MLATGVVGAVEDPWIRWSWISGHADVIIAALLQHIQLTLIAVVVGLLIAVPLGLLAWRSRVLRGPIFSVTGILYTIPSLALFSLLLPFTGLTIWTAEIGHVGYTLLILIRNIVVGLNSVPDEVREAARGMGFRLLADLARVDLPLAFPGILAGFRIAMFRTIGRVSVFDAATHWHDGRSLRPRWSPRDQPVDCGPCGTLICGAGARGEALLLRVRRQDARIWHSTRVCGSRRARDPADGHQQRYHDE